MPQTGIEPATCRVVTLAGSEVDQADVEDQVRQRRSVMVPRRLVQTS
jgi:hypothetical protein